MENFSAVHLLYAANPGKDASACDLARKVTRNLSRARPVSE